MVIFKLILPFLISFATQFIVIRLSKKMGFGIDDAEADKPQRVHDLPISRVGGVGILIAFATGVLLINTERSASQTSFLTFPLIASLLPPFLAGFYEDIKTGTTPKIRLFMIGLGAIISMLFLKSIIYDGGLFRLPLWIAIPFTIIAIVGVTNAINIIDGFNGLASGVSMIVLSSFAIVSYIQGDHFISNLCIVLASAIGGFFMWNFPKGRIFLGDGGAYLIGFLLALISIQLVKKNTEISPWFPVVVLSYPIFETLFSIYRRKFKSGSPLEADRVHLHTLIFKRIARSNPKTSVYIWILVFVFNVIAIPFRSNTYILILIFFVFAVSYVYLYRRIVRFKVKM